MKTKPYFLTRLCAGFIALGLAACVTAPAPPTVEPLPSLTPLPSNTPTATATPSLTPTLTFTPSVTPTHRPTVTPLPSERDDRPANVPAVELEPGGYLSWQGYVASLDDEQDWLAVFVTAGAGEDVTLVIQSQCGGGDTTRFRLFSANVTEASDDDGNGRIDVNEALATGATVADFDVGCLLRKEVTVPGGAEYYLVAYAASGGQTWYFVSVSR